MPTYYDDNFGHWDEMDDPDMVDFYRQVQRESIMKECVICGRTVKLRLLPCAGERFRSLLIVLWGTEHPLSPIYLSVIQSRTMSYEI